jgi:hypothetical protein
MVGSREGRTSARKSARLEKKRQREFGESSQGTNLGSRLQSDSYSEEELVVVTQEEEEFTSPSQIPNPDEWFERSPNSDRDEYDFSESSSDEMPTRLKYTKFRGDGKQDVDDWFAEFESIASANQEELDVKRRIFQGLMKGEALKWYQDVPVGTRNDWDEFTNLFLRAFREAGGEARALGRLSRMTMKTSESVRKYGQRVKALIQKLTTEVAPNLQVEWYVAGLPKKMGF